MTRQEAEAYEAYLTEVLTRHHLSIPLPAWAIDAVRECGKQQLLLLEVEAHHLVEKAKPEPREARLARLWSLVSRQRGRKRTYENVLSSIIEKHRAATGPTSLHALARAARG